ncbi:hypothetical protein Leryth_004638 [Lithospermum erythrorhizon]|nr:hypothetical protein Leryth_004638 [Lithospermum erythrorhizon]
MNRLNEIEGAKRDVAVKTPAPAAPASRRRAVRETATVNHGYSTRRSARLAEKIEEPIERSGAIKMNSFTEEIDENVEVEMKENSVDQSEISEITVLDNFKEYSLESEVKSSDETETISEEKVDIPNGDVVVASIEEKVASEIKFDTVQEEPEPVDGLMKVTENVCGMEPEGIIDNSEMSCNVDEETEASPEKDTEMSFNMNEEDEAFEVTEKKPNADDESKVSIEDTDMTSIVDEDIVVAEFKGNEKSDMSENESSDDEESIMSDENDDILVPEVEIQNELLNSEANHVSNFSGIGDAAKPFTCESDPIHIAAPLNNDELVSSIEPLNNSVSKMPPTVGRPTQISDDKENVDGGLKSVILKDEKPKKKPLEDLSMRELTRMFREKMAISKQQGKECDKEDDIKATTNRPALKTLSDNCMLVESQN